MLDFLKNNLFNRRRYKTDSEAVVVSCFYNPQNNPYRLLAFSKWYKAVKHLNHRVIECLIGPDANRQLPNSPYITEVRTESLLWHKEALINKIVAELPPHFRYIFVVDADVLFTNNDWLVRGVQQLQKCPAIQPFEYCVHLERNQLEPNFDLNQYRSDLSPLIHDPDQRHPRMWRSFSANAATHPLVAKDNNYDVHGHVGFAWGFRRELLEAVPLFDRGLIGGADHIIAHAAAGHIGHNCITKSFTENLEEVLDWSRRFYDRARLLAANERQPVGYVEGDLYHIWHGNITDRQYLRRIREFTPELLDINERDENGLYVHKGRNRYMKGYYRSREVTHIEREEMELFDADFFEEMGYHLLDLIDIIGQATYQDEPGTYEDSGTTGFLPESPEPAPVSSEPNPDDGMLHTWDGPEVPGTDLVPDNANPDDGMLHTWDGPEVPGTDLVPEDNVDLSGNFS